MNIIITQYGATICNSNNMTMLPRIGEKMRINRSCYEVEDVVWHIIENGNVYVEIKIV